MKISILINILFLYRGAPEERPSLQLAAPRRGASRQGNIRQVAGNSRKIEQINGKLAQTLENCGKLIQNGNQGNHHPRVTQHCGIDWPNLKNWKRRPVKWKRRHPYSYLQGWLLV